MLVAISPTKNSLGVKAWVCRCDCGKETIQTTSNLRLSNTKSCGCLLYNEKTNVFDAYLKDNQFTKKKNWLSLEEETKLIKRIKKGDKEALKVFVDSKLKLIFEFTKRFKKYAQNISMDDLIQEGNLILLNALKTFDPEKGIRFNSYLGKSLMMRAIHLSKRKKHLLYEHENKFTKEFTNKDGEALEYNIEDTESKTPPDIAESKLMIDYVVKMLKSLDKRSREIIIARFGINDGKYKTLKKTGDMFGITRERVRVIINCSLDKIRKKISNQKEG
jgi:RNA polymerase sigma factor (sigma-70 family)